MFYVLCLLKSETVRNKKREQTKQTQSVIYTSMLVLWGFNAN
jgi:hypothetical protein